MPVLSKRLVTLAHFLRSMSWSGRFTLLFDGEQELRSHALFNISYTPVCITNILRTCSNKRNYTEDHPPTLRSGECLDCRSLRSKHPSRVARWHEPPGSPWDPGPTASPEVSSGMPLTLSDSAPSMSDIGCKAKLMYYNYSITTLLREYHESPTHVFP